MFAPVETFFPRNKGFDTFVIKLKKSIQSSQRTEMFAWNHDNIEEKEKICGNIERNTSKYKEHSATKHTWSGNDYRVTHPVFQKDWR